MFFSKNMYNETDIHFLGRQLTKQLINLTALFLDCVCHGRWRTTEKTVQEQLVRVGRWQATLKLGFLLKKLFNGQL